MKGKNMGAEKKQLFVMFLSRKLCLDPIFLKNHFDQIRDSGQDSRFIFSACEQMRLLKTIDTALGKVDSYVVHLSIKSHLKSQKVLTLTQKLNKCIQHNSKMAIE